MYFQLILAILALSTTLPAKADTVYRYKAKCFAETPSACVEDLCTVIDTRSPNGALQTRSIFSSRFSLSIKSRFDPKGFVTWDSISNQEYRWDYPAEPGDSGVAYSRVMPGFLVEGIPWD